MLHQLRVNYITFKGGEDMYSTLKSKELFELGKKSLVRGLCSDIHKDVYKRQARGFVMRSLLPAYRLPEGLIRLYTRDLERFSRGLSDGV